MTTLPFDSTIAAYDRFLGRWSRLWIPALLAAARVAAGHRVLDVAAGTGEAALGAAALVGAAPPIVATDLSVAMLAVARGKRGDRALALAAMDGQALACRDRAFDAVLCALGAIFFPDPRRALAEMRRVLRPGRWAAASVWAAPERAPFPGILLTTFRCHLPALKAALEQPFALADAERLGTLFREAGFEDVEVRGETRRLEFDGFENFWAPIEAGGTRFAQAYLALPADAQRAIRDKVHAGMAPFDRGGRLVIDSEALIAAGRR